MINIKTEYTTQQITGEEEANTTLTLKKKTSGNHKGAKKNSKQHKVRSIILVMKKYK